MLWCLMEATCKNEPIWSARRTGDGSVLGEGAMVRNNPSG